MALPHAGGTLGFVELALAMTTVEKGTVLVLVCVLAAPIAALMFARSGEAWRSLGKGPLAIEPEQRPPPGREPSPAVERAVRAAEVRQMLEAKAARQRRRGERPLDVDAELRRLLGADAEADRWLADFVGSG